MVARSAERIMASAKLLLTLAEKQPARGGCGHSVAINLAEDDPYEERVEDFFGRSRSTVIGIRGWAWRPARLDGMSPGAITPCAIEKGGTVPRNS